VIIDGRRSRVPLRPPLRLGAMAADATAYGFTVEWFDRQADMIREYVLTAFVQPKGNLEVAMYDPKTNRSFLKRVEMPHLALQDFRIGAIVMIHARQLKVTSYNDDRTHCALEQLHGGVCFLTVPSMFRHFGTLLERFERAGLRVARLRLVNDNGPTFAVQLTGEDAQQRWTSIARSLDDGCMQKVTTTELDSYFDRSKFPSTAAFDNCTLCLIRPHAVRDGGVGTVISAIMEAGIEVAASQMLTLGRAEAAELFDVYKGVLPYYSELIDGMTCGPLVAIEARGAPGVCEQLREVCGPHDVDMARYLRPNSLRARLGKDNANNGVHSTDLEEDGEREVSYVFGHLLGK